MSNFWLELAKPFFILAPMEDVTDTVFRRVILAASNLTSLELDLLSKLSQQLITNTKSLDDFYQLNSQVLTKNSYFLDILGISNPFLPANKVFNHPEVLFTEFTNVSGIQSVGQSRVIHRLKYLPVEKPLVAQVWGVTPTDYFKSSKLILELGFDGIDINMGCPVRNVIKQGACSALIKNPTLAQEIICAVREGCDYKLPVSIKTRIGFSQIDTENWCGFLLEKCQPEVLTVHGRTVAEQSKVPCHFEEIGKVAAINRKLQTNSDQNISTSKKTLIVANGDILTTTQGLELSKQYGLDGIMIGRAIFKNPWLFSPNFVPTVKDRLNLLLLHLNLWDLTWQGLSETPGFRKAFNILKKYFKIYIIEFTGAGELRAKLMETRNIEEAKKLVLEGFEEV